MESYRRLCTRFYDADKPQAPKDAFDFYLRYCERAQGPVLEVMSGSGRFLVPIMERGIDIDGVDVSPDMLEACRQRCREKGLSPRLYEQSVEQLALPRQYGLVMIPASSFCLLTEQQKIQDGLRRIFAVMRAGAKFIAEVELHMQRKSRSWPWRGRWVDLPGGGKIIISTLATYDAVERIMRSINRYDHMKNGKLCETEMEEFNLRYYDRDEFSGLLASAGFNKIECFKPYSGETAVDSDESVVYECQKP